MDNIALSQGGNVAFASGALANGTTAGTIKTTVAVPFIVDGTFYSKAITDNIAFTVTLPATYGVATNGAFTGGANGSTRLYGVFMDKTGAVSMFPGEIADTAALAAGTQPLKFPAPRKDRVCIGCVRIALTAGTTFIPGTTALGAAGVTTTYINLATLPAEPLRA